VAIHHSIMHPRDVSNFKHGISAVQTCALGHPVLMLVIE
jgi:hypothetical protein